MGDTLLLPLLLPPMLLPLSPLMLMLPLLSPLPLLLLPMLTLPQLLLLPPLLSTRSATTSTMFPRSLSRSTFPPTPPATSSTTPQLLELPSPMVLLLPPLLPELPELLLFNYLQESRTQAGQQAQHLESDKPNMT